MQELLEAGARVDLPNDDGLTALTLAEQHLAESEGGGASGGLRAMVAMLREKEEEQQVGVEKERREQEQREMLRQAEEEQARVRSRSL